MKDILLQHRDHFVECEIDGLKFTYAHSDDPKRHYILTLRDQDAYQRLKREVRKIYESCDNKIEGYDMACGLLETADQNEFFTNDIGLCHCDPRDEEEIIAYHKEAEDKVWLMRSCYIADKEPVHEASRSGMERILNTYDDIPKDGYTDWECGYWNGIMGALRWVMGEEKDWLDT